MTKEAIEPGKAYTTTQAGIFLRYTENYIRRLIRHGRIIATKPTGGHHRIIGEAIQRILDGLDEGGRVQGVPKGQPADEIQVTEEQMAIMFGNRSRTAGYPAKPPTDDENDGSIYALMRRKYG